MRTQRSMAGASGVNPRGGTGITHVAIRLLRMMFLMSCMTAMNTVLAQTVPLQVGAMYEIRDERDILLNGTHPSSPFYGVPYVEGDLVYVMQCDNGISPPNTDGSSSFNTPLLFISRIGIGTVPIFQRPARFSDGVIPRPAGEVFIRVFNAPTIADATFYVDSQIHTMGNADAIFRIECAKTIYPIDPNDDDNDGLNNSWELSYGTDLNDQDSDDDGIMDGLEHLSGLDPLDADSNLAMSRITYEAGNISLQWTSATGTSYSVESMPQGSSDGAYTPIMSGIVATSQLSKIIITNDANDAVVCYRVTKN